MFVGKFWEGALFLGIAKLIEVCLKLSVSAWGDWLFPKINTGLFYYKNTGYFISPKTNTGEQNKITEETDTQSPWLMVPGYSHAWNPEAISILEQLSYVSHLLFFLVCWMQFDLGFCPLQSRELTNAERWHNLSEHVSSSVNLFLLQILLELVLNGNPPLR